MDIIPNSNTALGRFLLNPMRIYLIPIILFVAKVDPNLDLTPTWQYGEPAAGFREEFHVHRME